MPAVLLLGATSCSLAFDVDALRDGDGAGSSASAAGPAVTSSSASSSAETSSASGEGGDGLTTSASTSAATGSGGHGGDGATGSTGTGRGGADGAGGAGGMGGDVGSGGGGGACPGARWCEREGASADLCFDFDGDRPLAGVDVYEPDPVGVTTEVDVVEDPTLSCPRAVRVRVLEASESERAFAGVGPDLAADQGHHFLWELSVLRVSVAEATASSRTVAILSWEHLGTTCQTLIQLRDTGGAGGVSVYSQGDDGTGWVQVGYVSTAVDHLTLGEWTRVGLEVDTEMGQLRVLVGDNDVVGDLDPLCGPADDQYDIDVGAHYTDVEQENVYDDIAVRLIP